MRARRFLFPLLIFCAGCTAAVGLALSRYDGAALHGVLTVLLLTAVACPIALVSIYLNLKSARPVSKLAVYLALALLASAAAACRAIGFDGILPRRDGTQSVGLAVLWVNTDMFGLIIGAAALACRRIFRRQSRSR